MVLKIINLLREVINNVYNIMKSILALREESEIIGGI